MVKKLRVEKIRKDEDFLNYLGYSSIDEIETELGRKFTIDDSLSFDDVEILIEKTIERCVPGSIAEMMFGKERFTADCFKILEVLKTNWDDLCSL